MRTACARLLDLLRLWRQRIAERRALLRLTACELRDFGANRSEAIGEWRKPFWRQ